MTAPFSDSHAQTPEFTVGLRGFDMDEVRDLARRTHAALASNDRDEMAEAVRAIRQTQFRVRFRGFDRAQVTEYFNRLGSALEHMSLLPDPPVPGDS